MDAVKRVKRSPLYRRRRSSLLSPAPCDVWQEDETNEVCVLFSSAADGASRSYLGFVLDSDTKDVREAGLVTVAYTPEGWRADVSA